MFLYLILAFLVFRCLRIKWSREERSRALTYILMQCYLLACLFSSLLVYGLVDDPIFFAFMGLLLKAKEFKRRPENSGVVDV